MENEAVKKFKMLSDTAESLSEEIPVQLVDKMRIYGQMLDVVKDLAAAAKNDAKRLYAQRKAAYANYFLSSGSVKNPTTGKTLTSAERKEYAEYHISDLRLKEADAEAEAEQWKLTFETLVEQINIMKYKARGNESTIKNAVY